MGLLGNALKGLLTGDCQTVEECDKEIARHEVYLINAATTEKKKQEKAILVRLKARRKELMAKKK